MAETAEKKGKTKVLMEETRLFEPPKELVENSNVMQWMKKKGFKTETEMRKWCSDNYVEFWDEMAKTYVDWFKPYTKVMDDSDKPYFKWYTGGLVNMTYNAVDRHAKGAKRDKVAYIWVPEPTDQATQKITYGELSKEVNKFANGLKSLGVKKGDRISLYMPMIPQLPIAMLACAKLGAIHSIVFSGFSAKGFGDRVKDCEAKVAITTDGFYRRGKPMPLKANADEAIADAPSVEHMVVFKRTGIDVDWKEGRDIWWHDLIKGQSDECEPEKLDPEHRLFILYTSGTTGKPKGIEHAQGGYCVGPAQTLHWVFDIKDDDVWWCTADIGWITGHSYIVYGPLCLGCTGVMYEGSPDFPDFGRWWKLIQDNKVSVLYTAPTAIRMFMKQGPEWPAKYDLSSLRLLGSVGEPINPEAWMWYREHIGGGKLQIMDTWWQTETGTFLNSPLPITPLKPGSCTFPLPGFNITIYDELGNEVPLGEGGNIVSETPWPSMLRAFYKDRERYHKEYWEMYWDTPKRGTYLAGDKATRDKDGYFWIQGRIDDVLSVAGHRIANAEVESAIVAHPKAAEAAVVGKPDEVKGEAIVAFVILKVGVDPSPELGKELITHVRKTLGPVAMPSEIHFVNDLPKTRSGKIMRRVVKAKALGNPTGDVSALANPEAVDGIPLIV
ncbi:MAG: Acetyl-coenzyme A synthetase [Methanothrix harundinacea]|uniref:Acetyl-coenzyme A synthetase n=1 Tax=Methanothrix harundinacea TaxID=301375 RepID=A0A101ILR2_9EURY|nr:MAG: Acetyl-coenzyme A synthetase [Methanothrix harundinacea]